MFLNVPRDYHLTLAEQIAAVMKLHPRAEYLYTANRVMVFILIDKA